MMAEARKPAAKPLPTEDGAWCNPECPFLERDPATGDYQGRCLRDGKLLAFSKWYTPHCTKPQVERVLSSLGRALARGARRGMRAKTIFGLREHIVVEHAKAQLFRPVQEAFSEASAVMERMRAELDKGEGQRLFSNLTEEQLAELIRNAEWHWVVFICFGLLSAIFLAWASTQSGITGFNAMLAGIAAVFYSAILALRTARDLVVFRTRMPISVRTFFAKLDSYWFPLPTSHPAHTICRKLIVPAVVGTLLAAPIIGVI